MKLSRYIETFALVAMLAACSTEEEQVHFAGNEVKVNATIGGKSIFTRSNPVGTKEEQMLFNDNDRIGIGLNNGTPVLYEKKNDIWQANDSKKALKWETSATEFKAYYPYDSNSFENGHIRENQSNEDLIALSDYMIADRTEPSIPDNRELDLDFERQTARVIVNITEASFTNEFTHLHLSKVRFFSQTNIPATPNGEVKEITPYHEGSDENWKPWIALVAPNAGDEGKNFMSVVVYSDEYPDGKTFYVKGIPNLEKRKSYTYDLKIGKDRATIENVEVADWTTGSTIPGGEASAITVESIKESIAAQLRKGNDVVLTLNSNASSDIFDAIKTTIKDKGVADGSVNLTLKSVITIPEGIFKDVTWLNKVTLPDAVTIGKNAFSGSSLKDIEAPNVSTVKMQAFSECKKLEDVNLPKVSEIDIKAFYFCSTLKTVLFGTLTKVWTGDENNEDGLFKSVNTQDVSLILSSSQSMLTLAIDAEARFFWTPINNPYKGSDENVNTKFLGYKFKEIKFREE